MIAGGIFLVLVVIGMFTSSPEDEDKEAAGGASTTTTAAPTTTQPPSTAAVTSSTTEATTTTTTSPASIVIEPAKVACEAAGKGYSMALQAFIDHGPSAATAAMLDPVDTALAEFKRHLSDPGAADLLHSVETYVAMNENLRILYSEGETAYQAKVPATERDSVLRAEAEDSWTKGVSDFLGRDTPTPPSDYMRDCG